MVINLLVIITMINFDHFIAITIILCTCLLLVPHKVCNYIILCKVDILLQYTRYVITSHGVCEIEYEI